MDACALAVFSEKSNVLPMTTVLAAYQHGLEKGALQPDAAQLELVERLNDFFERANMPAVGLLTRLFKREPKDASLPKGFYIHGAVGRGKSFIMDLAFEVAPFARKRRVHFHSLMGEVHTRLRDLRHAMKRGDLREGDPIPLVGQEICRDLDFLCLDEFMVNDIADAMILGRLFEYFFAQGLIVLITSNVQPALLYHGGLNRALFLPFIDLIEQNMTVFELLAMRDYRLIKLRSMKRWTVPSEGKKKSGIGLRAHFDAIVAPKRIQPVALQVFGRALVAPYATDEDAFFTFAELCEQPLGAQDYVALASRFRHIFLDGVPLLSDDNRVAAARFILLIDALYDARAKLTVHAAAPLEKIFSLTHGLEAFACARTVSRLNEMGSEEYLREAHLGDRTLRGGDTAGLVET